jgi:membrane-associated phospholipid phosphatase
MARRYNPQGAIMRNRLASLPSVLLMLVLFFSGPPNALGGDDIEQSGDILQYLLATSALGATAIKHDGEGTVQFAKSFALSLGVTAALKYSVNEERPDGEDYSFPSWHTSFSFTSAEFMRKRYGWEYGFPAYVAASFVGYSRVEADRHYWHDVFAGAFIGIASSYLLTKPYQGVSVAVIGDHEFVGIRLSRNW